MTTAFTFAGGLFDVDVSPLISGNTLHLSLFGAVIEGALVTFGRAGWFGGVQLVGLGLGRLTWESRR